MTEELKDVRVAILAAGGVERVELEQPRHVLDDAGAFTALVSIASGSISARDHDLEDAGSFTVDRDAHDVTPDDFDALLLPGGTVNLDKLRMDATAVSFVRDFVDSGSPSPPSATGRGHSPRPTACGGDGSRRGQACAPICGTPVPTWSMRWS